MGTEFYNILLADDDADDCMFFSDALDELDISSTFSTVNNGVELMSLLKDKAKEQLPDILFLDLNMPRKPGIECLTEIYHNENLKQLPVIIYSTSSNPEVIEALYNLGAQYYIRKPADFEHLKSVIYKALILAKQNNFIQPSLEEFVIQP